MPGFGVIGAETNAAVNAVADAGLDGVLVQAYWDRLQSGGAGSALDTAQVAVMNGLIETARTRGLTVSFEHAPHYPPAWVKSAVVPFTDHAGNGYTSADPGKDVRNWVWSANGRTYLEDFYRKVWDALTPANRAAISYVKFGAGYYGEIQYPVEIGGAPYRYWGGGTMMQNGTGLAAGLSACPVPGYTPFTGTDAQDVQYINWYLGGIENFVAWQITLLKSIGWTCRLYALHSGYSTRTNNGRSSNGWRENLARGQDFVRMVSVYKRDPQVHPWCTWLGGPDGWHTPTVDSDSAAWKNLYAVAAARGKHHLIGGENTGGESNEAMDEIVDRAFAISAPTGLFYSAGQPHGAWQGYERMEWLNYATLTGGSQATLARYKAARARHV